MKDKFRALLSSYILEPSENVFYKLKGLLADLDDEFTIEFLDILWSRVKKSNKYPIIIKHLGILLMIRGRRVESEYYLLRWIGQNQNDIEALNILQFISTERANLHRSEWCINQLERCKAGEEILLNAKICHHLVSGHDDKAHVLAYEMIKKGFKGARSVSSLIQIALRKNDFWIAKNALSTSFSKLAIDSLGERQKRKLIQLTRNVLINVLNKYIEFKPEE